LAMVGTAFTVRLKSLFTLAVTLSVAVTVKLYAAATAGAVPPSTPAEDKVSPEGRFGLVHVIVPVPPVAVKVCE